MKRESFLEACSRLIASYTSAFELTARIICCNASLFEELQTLAHSIFSIFGAIFLFMLSPTNQNRGDGVVSPAQFSSESFIWFLVSRGMRSSDVCLAFLEVAFLFGSSKLLENGSPTRQFLCTTHKRPAHCSATLQHSKTAAGIPAHIIVKG